MRYQLKEPQSAEIVIRFVEFDDAPATEVWSIELESSDAASESLGGRAAVEDLLAATFTDEGGYPPFVLDVRQNYYEWGASGAGETFVISILGDLVYDVLKAHFKKLAERAKGPESDGLVASSPMTAEEAEERARWKIGGMFGVDREALEARTISQSSSGWTVTFRYDETEYEVRLGLERGYPVVAEATMTKLD